MSHRAVTDTARQDRRDRASPYSRNGASSRSGSGSDDRWQHDLYQGQSGRSDRRGGFHKTNEPSPKLIIEGLHWEVTESELQDLFQKIGPVAKAFLKYDRSGRPTGTAIVIFHNVSDAESAKEEYDGANAKGQPITISYEQMRPPRKADSGGAASTDLRSRMDLLSRFGSDRPQPPAGTPKGPAAAQSRGGVNNGSRDGSNREKAPRGGGRGGGRGSAQARGGGRERQKPKTATELDAELEAFMKKPAPAAKDAAAPDTKPDGDVEMA